MQIRKGYLIFLLLFMWLILTGCGSSSSDAQGTSSLPTNESKVTAAQGVWGNVWFWSGNFMPSVVGTESSPGNITPVVREIFVYKATTKSDVMPYSFGEFYSYIPSELVAQTSSDETGFFQVTLSPGTYSIFVKEGSAFYANKFDGQGRVNPVEVVPGAVTKLQIDINYQATF